MSFFNRKFKFIGWSLLCLLLQTGTAFAQEENYVLAHQDVFGKMQRPAVHFPHAAHEEALSDEGCGACHHVFDEQVKKLVYTEGEEQECKTCHGLKPAGTSPALREAYHKSCTGCHRLKKKNIEKSGPTTCGECHPKK